MSTHPDPSSTSASVYMGELLDRALDEMRPSRDVGTPGNVGTPGAANSISSSTAQLPPMVPPMMPPMVPPMVPREHSEISGLLRALQRGRNALEQATIENLHNTTAKLDEVSSATEVATTGLLDGLDRALAMIDELDALAGSNDVRASKVRAMLRDELFQSIDYLQFQDITTQQLSYASSILTDMEQRLAGMAGAFDASAVDVPSPVPAPPPGAPGRSGAPGDPSGSGVRSRRVAR